MREKNRRAEKAMRTGTGKIEFGKYCFSKGEWLRHGTMGSLIGAVIAWLVYHSFYALPLAVVSAAVYLLLTKRRLREERRQALQYHFRDFLSSLHTALAAGYSMENGLRSAAADVEKLYGNDDLLCLELRDMQRQMDYQTPVETLFLDLGERSGVEDIRNFGEVLTIAKRTGGNMDRVLASTWRNLCEKIDTEKEIQALVAAKRYEQGVMSLMPAGVILYLKAAFPDLLAQMYGNLLGVSVMTACLGLYLFAFFLGRRMTAALEV